MPSRSRAFTLVELLVVVGIVAVLIALLMPALTKVRKHAQEVHCAANLHSIGHALTLYTQEFGHYPGTLARHLTPDDPVAWVPRLRLFLGGNRDVFYCPAQDERGRWGDASPAPVVPAAGLLLTLGYAPGEPIVHQGARFSYGYNGAGTGNMGSVLDGTHRGLGWSVLNVNDPNARRAGKGELRANRVKVPAEMIAIADSTADTWSDFVILPLATPHYAPGQVHRGGANVLFCDGHVQWHAQKDLMLNPPGPGFESDAGMRIRRMWNNDNQP